MVSEVYYFGEDSFFELGRKHAYIIAKRKSRLSQFLQNQLMITVEKLDDKWCLETVSKLKNNNIDVLIGYPSAIHRVALYILEKNISLPMKGIITISEVLTSDVRNLIQQAFSCYPISRYSTEEFGVLANQDISGQFFILNQCNYFIEVLKVDSNEKVGVGELGRIVVTDFFNKSMPLIRYDTGDLAKPYEIVNGLVTKIESVEGRRLAVIRDINGEVVSSFSINAALRESMDIVQFQFSQETASNYNLKLVVKEAVNELDIISVYKEILGSSAEINIEYVDDIPAQKSGKRPYILQNYY